MEQKDKPKGRPGRTFPVTFVVDQQLEACVLAIKKNPRYYGIDVIRFSIEIIGEHKASDQVGFLVTIYRIGTSAPSMRIQGILRRWEGTSTLVEGKTHALDPNPWGSRLMVEYILSLSTMLILLVLVIPVIDTLNLNAPLSSVIYLTGFIGVFVTIVLAYRYFNKRWLIRRLRKMVETRIVRR